MNIWTLILVLLVHLGDYPPCPPYQKAGYTSGVEKSFTEVDKYMYVQGIQMFTGKKIFKITVIIRISVQKVAQILQWLDYCT